MTLAIDITNAATGRAMPSIVSAKSASNTPGPVRAGLPAFIPGDQVYYWSYAWQDSQRKAIADLREGRYRDFDDPQAAVRFLLGLER